MIFARSGILAMDGEVREIQLDGVKRQRLFRSNMKNESTDLEGKRGER